MGDDQLKAWVQGYRLLDKVICPSDTRTSLYDDIEVSLGNSFPWTVEMNKL